MQKNKKEKIGLKFKLEWENRNETVMKSIQAGIGKTNWFGKNTNMAMGIGIFFNLIRMIECLNRFS